jgi:hypothetical protein
LKALNQFHAGRDEGMQILDFPSAFDRLKRLASHPFAAHESRVRFRPIGFAAASTVLFDGYLTARGDDHLNY